MPARPLLLRGGRVHSPAHPAATALAVEDGMVVWIGDDDGAALHAGADVVDLDGAFVTPAFVDAHAHVTDTGLALTGIDLRECPSLAAALAAVEAAARQSRGRPLLGSGWDETVWPEGRPPTAAELDRASYGGLVYLARVDLHSAAVSSSLLAALPGTQHTEGWVREPHHDAVRSAALGALTAGQRRDAQRRALHAAAALGIACVHEMAGPVTSSAEDLAGLLALTAAEPLPEVLGYWGELMGVQAARELGAVGCGGDLFVDGSLGSGTAALTEPYHSHPGSTGMLRHETAELAEHIEAALAAGLQTGFHAIGDAAVDRVLDAYETVSRRWGRNAGAGQRIEHAEYVRDPARLAASGLLASMQPCFDAVWGGPEGMYAQRLGPARALDLNRFAELAAAGVPLAFGSDSPVTGFGPWQAVRAAAHPSDPSAGISPRAAFAAHTRAGWRAAGRHGEGVLSPGAPATFAVWSAGELAVDAPDERVSRWSTDPRAAVPGLPDVAPGVQLPACRATVLRGAVLYDDGVLGTGARPERRY